MLVRSAGGFRRLFLVVAIMIGVGWPALGVGAQQDRATPVSATPETDATPVALGPVEPLATAALVPADVPLYVAFGLDPASDQWAQSEELIRRAGLEDLFDQAVAGFQAEAIASGEGDLSAFMGGEVALAVTSFAAFMEMGGVSSPSVLPLTPPAAADDAAAPAGIIGLIRAGDPDAAEELARTLTAADASGFDVPVTDTEYRGVTISAVVPRSTFDEGTAVARLGDTLVVSSTAADLEPLIDVYSGGAPALADAEPFTRVRADLPNDFLAYGVVNGPAYLTEIEPFLEAAGAEFGAAFPMDQALAGLEAYSGFTLWADDLGFRFDTITIPVAGATLPPMPDNFDTTLDERVPGDSLLFVNSSDLGLTLGPSLDVLGMVAAMAATEDPTFPIPIPAEVTDAAEAGTIYDLLSRFLAFNPRTALVDQLVGEWAFALSVASPDPDGISSVFVSDAEDELLLNDAVTKLAVWVNLLVIGGLASLPGGEEAIFGDQPVGARTEEVDGALTQIIEIPVPDMDASVRLQWGIIDGQLVFGVGDGFTEYVSGPADALADSPRYQSAMGELPAEHNVVFYLDLAQTIALVQPLLEQEFSDQGASLPGAVGTPAAGSEFPDLSAIQAFAAVGFQRDDLQGTSAILLIEKQ